MDHREIAGLMTALAPIVGDFVSKAVAPLRAENERLAGCLQDIEKRFLDIPSRDENSVLILRLVEETVTKLPPAPAGKDGTDADPTLIAELVDKAVAALEPAKSVEIEDIVPLIAAEVERAVADIPKPTNGKDADPVEIAALLIPEVERAVAQLPKAENGKDGTSVSIDDVAPLIVEEVSKAIAAIPVPENGKDGDPGKSVTAEDLAPVIDDMVQKRVAEMPPAKDGLSIAGALIDREGQLVLTFSDGATKTLGVVVGKDVDQDEIERLIIEEVGKTPRPKDGLNGLGFEDMTVEHDGERGFILNFERGDLKKEFKFTIPSVLERGVWREENYEKGDGVTWGGQFYIAQRETTEVDKPGTSDGWRLAIKRGRDGKDGKDGKQGERGLEGKAGRDMTQRAF